MKTSALAFAAILSAAGIAAPMAAHAQASKAAPMTGAAATQAEPAPIARVEARIRDMHDKLGITAAQTPQWNAFADAMRNNARTERTMQLQRIQEAATANAVDNLRGFQTMAETHAAGVKSLVGPFQAVYDSLSDAQKVKADAMFRQSSAKASAKAAAK
jgi:hypothetical protein